ncbi:MAG: adenylyl-sulfate kinase [Deltaproteobacteria bacterium]|nr:adenylyl-sulfate kinase [Deltaproteobacteria bacterium]
MSEPVSTNITWHHGAVTRADREARNGNRGVILWYTGLSGCGKSTIALEVEKRLFDLGKHTYLLDGDNIRFGLNSNLGFAPQDRTENIRRIGEVAKLFVDAGIIVATAFISPYRADRDRVRALVAPGDMLEIFLRCDISVCEQRDPKGLYKKARAGEINDFTGVSAPYEEPLSPEIVLDSGAMPVDACARAVVEYLQEHGYI